MIRIDNPADVGRVMGHVRTMLGVGMRRFARQVANRTGRSEDTIRHQLWAWETGRNVPGMAAATPFLAELGMGLALVPLDEGGPESAPESTLTDEPPLAGVSGWVYESQTLTEALRLLRGALHLARHGERAPGGSETWDAWAADTEALLREADRPAGVVLVDDGTWEWHWAPTKTGSYSGPHGPDICPAIGCQHEDGAA